VIHPQVALHFKQWLSRQTTTFAVLESAILFESGFGQLVDIRMLVVAPRALCIKRVMDRDGLTEAEVIQRMQHQLPDEEKKILSDIVIHNDDTHALIPQIERWYYLMNN
jgi:dephospho-CoA kinase